MRYQELEEDEEGESRSGYGEGGGCGLSAGSCSPMNGIDWMVHSVVLVCDTIPLLLKLGNPQVKIQQ